MQVVAGPVRTARRPLTGQDDIETTAGGSPTMAGGFSGGSRKAGYPRRNAWPGHRGCWLCCSLALGGLSVCAGLHPTMVIPKCNTLHAHLTATPRAGSGTAATTPTNSTSTAAGLPALDRALLTVGYLGWPGTSSTPTVRGGLKSYESRVLTVRSGRGALRGREAERGEEGRSGVLSFRTYKASSGSKAAKEVVKVDIFFLIFSSEVKANWAQQRPQLLAAATQLSSPDPLLLLELQSCAAAPEAAPLQPAAAQPQWEELTFPSVHKFGAYQGQTWWWLRGGVVRVVDKAPKLGRGGHKRAAQAVAQQAACQAGGQGAGSSAAGGGRAALQQPAGGPAQPTLPATPPP
ncbi:hypothetical protein HaLaN_09352 [Haematococcus lacustris]|uniref:Uncharacterized protein n=1 Tax=Haematococcus lacustris TaxID=44745 RepID=A0A699YTI8_HAELA|nr:hypothetical protein HaLaN_09352 [Haematococcus lacustris]